MLQVGDTIYIEEVKGRINKTLSGRYYIYISDKDRFKLANILGATDLVDYSKKILSYFEYAYLDYSDVPDFYTLDELERWLNTLNSIIETKRHIKFLK